MAMNCQDCGHPLDMHRRWINGAFRCTSFGCGCEVASVTPTGLTGTVTEQYGPGGMWTVIECADAPPHLRIHHLIPLLSGCAKLGDRVRLVYHVGLTRSLWMVAEVLPK